MQLCCYILKAIFPKSKESQVYTGLDMRCCSKMFPLNLGALVFTSMASHVSGSIAGSVVYEKNHEMAAFHGCIGHIQCVLKKKN